MNQDGVRPPVAGGRPRPPAGGWRPSPVFLLLVALLIGSGMLAWSEGRFARAAVVVGVLTGWLVSLCLHEYAHALLAYRFGDRGVASRGYLRLNPLTYSHPLLSIGLPVLVVLLGGIGLPGGAVWIDRHHIPGRLRHSLVSLAGPAVNVTLAVLLALPFAIGVDVTARPGFWAGVALLGFLQITAGVLNLLPVPGLDGGNIVAPWLSPSWQRGYQLLAPYGFIALFALLWDDRIGGAFFWLVFALGDLVGLPSGLYHDGLRLVRFWS
ncbi:site-2 protease family protein [Solwaraspora sp. WMMD406]|uniref:site-2 protease family protein n=1 Tax=Solwaraspora sp. WMMD406 TaxID=3016095 RepID=UPI002417F209|nr:site-2 protease family protein [Solwaraspora sp. WMMD406]MDG4765130.1 site-2 protease family protein [Solwaraspora sp. WMMD406]